jgi:hypothetical protein
MTIRPKVALSQDFLLTISKLPPSIHTKVLKWTVQFQTHPTSAGINYEKINRAVDPHLRSVRIDQDYRGIVFQSAEDNVYILLHVDRHDEAYQWAARRQMKVHPVTGALQILVLEEVASPVAPSASTGAENGGTADATPPPHAVRPFSAVAREDLLYFGVPAEAVQQVQGVAAVSELEALRAAIGVAAYEALSLLADGFSVADVREDLESRQVIPVDTSDIAASLDTDESRASFYIVENEEELTAVLNSPLSQWRVFLHPKQRRLATSDVTGAMRVLGGAGTGKTVLAMHRAKWLAENRTGPGQRVLFTTFTRNLAGDIEANLGTLCSRETMKKIEVVNLDRWVRGFLSGKLYEHRIQYDLGGEARAAWDKAMALRDTSLPLAPGFYEAEWEQVIAANGISTLDEYRAARRVGRGGALARNTRDAIWPVFEDFRRQLTARKLKMVDDAYRDAAALLAQEAASLSYSAIVVDETQDFGPMALRLLRQMVPAGQNDMFFVGDGHQRIYKRHRAAMSKCGINIVGRSRKLYLNYRTTDEIRRVATALLDGYPVDDLDDGQDTNKGYTSLSHGPLPDIRRTVNLDRGIETAIDGALTWRSESQVRILSQCLIVPNGKIRSDIANALSRKDAPIILIDADHRDKGDTDAIRLATMHRAKGLEFDRVTVLVSKSVLDGPNAEETDRKLLYVALTRAKREARIVAY